MARENVTPMKLREDIDRGKTRSKVPAPDPATSPLGTDEEAAGTPIPPQAVEMAMRNEVDAAPEDSQAERSDPAIPLYLVVMALFAAALSAMAVLFLF